MTTSTTRPALQASTPRIRSASRSVSRSLTGWLVGFGASVLADQVFFLSLTWAALKVGSPTQVGVVLAAGSIPRLLILLIGGAVADRTSPKRIIIGTDSGRSVVMAGAAVLLMLGHMHTWGLVLVALAIGALDGLFLPAVGALPARVAPSHLMSRVAALRTVTQRTAMLLGGPLAGWLIYLYGPSAAFYGSAALFALSVGSLALVKLSPPETRGPADAAGPVADVAAGPAVEQGFVQRVVSGLGLVRRDPVLGCLLVLIAGMNLGFAGPVTAGLPLLSAANGWGVRGAGLLLGGFGLGATVSGVSLIFVRWIPHAGKVALSGVFVMGVALAAVGSLHSFAGALVATVVLGLASGVFGTVVHAMVLTSTPEAELGRVMVPVSLSIEGVVPISFAVTGLLSGVLGPHATCTAGGAVILVSTLIAVGRRQLRSFELVRPSPAPAAAPVAR